MDKIDLVISSLRGGGAERVCTTVANELVSRGFNVRLTVLNLENSIYDSHLDNKVELVNLNKPNARKSALSLLQFLIKNKPSKILVFNHELAVILVFFRTFFKFKFEIIARNINVLSVKRSNEQSVWHKYFVHIIIKRLYNNVDKVIAQSNGMKEDLVQYYNFKPEKINVINNPVSNKLENYGDSCSVVKKNDEILFVGRLSKQKGIQNLLEALKICLKEVPELKLRIVGEGPLEKEISSLIKKMGIEKSVIMEGFCNDIAPHYANAKVTVLSSLYEGFPNVLVESISVGTPVVSFDCPSGPSEIIRHDINGYLVEYLNIQDLANKIMLALRKEWDIEIIKNSSTPFKKESIVDKYLAVLEGSDVFSK
ncbi:Glycosyltransferase involved in cell wall bisynthesis [Mesobacillus persicus]|uniref:Glycosyltransferase involved in cell wall bisynthesis n=1 Tax=Mesobacillus persicus TaxID=930146 RepID=A0A1H8A912_9BACI|nr:glycosyltransferase [Mesobacillus persicus]SEM66027.1 Glycosyltransferase involved in cell wall bisynthesis [Mesobacillus persicus]